MIPQTKIGDCSRCPKKNTRVKKRGKDLICLLCCKKEDSKKQLERQKNKVSNGLKNKVRKLVDDKNVSELKIDLDRIFSLYTRIKYATPDGLVQCFTCSNILHYKQMHNGHFISRSDSATRYLEYNNKPQCPMCNSKHEIDTAPFEKALEAEYPGITEYLFEQASIVYKFSQHELKEMILEYRAKLKMVKSKLTPTEANQI